MWFWLMVVAVVVVIGLLTSRWFGRYRAGPVEDERFAAQASAEAERRKYDWQ